VFSQSFDTAFSHYSEKAAFGCFEVVVMTTSNRSAVGSARSNKTTASAVSAAHARAEAEAAEVRASYASQEAKLKLEKAVREAERATRDAHDKLETIRLDTELEVLTLHREADAAIVTARVLEDAEAMQSVIEDGKPESEKEIGLLVYVCHCRSIMG
jgi:hypothetical protein